MFSLIWTNLKSYYGLSQLAYYGRKRDIRLLGAAGIIVAVLVALAPLAYYYWRLLDEIYLGALMFGQPQLVITTAFVSCSLLVLLLGVAYVLSVFYFSNDLDFLVPLPLHPYQILAAKTVVVWVSQLIIIAPFFWLAAILYGVREGAAWTFYLLSVAVYLVLPLIPTAIITILIMLMMRLSNLSRHKDAMRLAGMFLLTIGIVVVTVVMSRVPPGHEAEFIQRILAQEEGLIIQAARVYPPALWGTRALTATGFPQILNLGLTVLSSVAFVAAALAAAQRWFLAGLIGSGETVTSSTQAGAVSDFAMSKHPIITIMQKEMKMLVRTPIYLFNSLGIVLILPLLWLIPLIFTGGLNLDTLRGFLGGQEALLPLIGVGFVATMALVAPASSSSFSREGKHIWIAKTMPVHARVQVQGRLLQGYVATAWCIPFVVLFGLTLADWTLPQLLVVVAMGLLVSFPLILANLLVDLINPHLKWENPQQAIKQNLNVLIGLIVGGAILYGQGHVSYLLWEGGHGAGLILLFLAATSLALGALLYAVVHYFSSYFFNQIHI